MPDGSTKKLQARFARVTAPSTVKCTNMSSAARASAKKPQLAGAAAAPPAPLLGRLVGLLVVVAVAAKQAGAPAAWRGRHSVDMMRCGRPPRQPPAQRTGRGSSGQHRAAALTCRPQHQAGARRRGGVPAYGGGRGARRVRVRRCSARKRRASCPSARPTRGSAAHAACAASSGSNTTGRRGGTGNGGERRQAHSDTHAGA